MEPIEIQRLKDWFDYDPVRGVISRKLKMRSDALDEIRPDRGWVKLNGKKYPYAVVCWVLYYDAAPNGWVDHKNRIHSDNRIENLREATPTQNQQNKAGYGTYAKGVTWRDRILNPWQAKIRVNGTRIHLGSFSTEEEAAEAYRQAALEHHGEFACLE